LFGGSHEKVVVRLNPVWRVMLAIMMVTGSVSTLGVDAVSADAPFGTRALPSGTVSPGQTFNGTVTFTAPADLFNSMVFTDFAPTGWTVAVSTSYCTPPAFTSNAVGNRAEYIWATPEDAPGYANGTAFTAVYRVTVPSNATAGTYNFTNGTIEYYIGGTGPTLTTIGGNTAVTVAIPDITPTVLSTIPVNGTANIPVNTSITVNFSEPMNQTATETAFSRSPSVSGNFTWPNENTTVFTPLANLAYKTVYNVTIGAGAKDLAGNNLNITALSTFSFTTAVQPPEVVTNTATPITANSAVLNGNLTSKGSATTAKFTVAGLNIAPASVKTGETVTVTATVTNSDGSQGTYSVILKVNGAQEATKDLTLNAGATEKVSFNIKKTAAGTYSVDVNGQTSQFTVTQDAATPVAPPTGDGLDSTTIIIILVVVAAAAGILAYFLLRKRHA
jgi:hypothetical protein